MEKISKEKIDMEYSIAKSYIYNFITNMINDDTTGKIDDTMLLFIKEQIRTLEFPHTF